MEVEDEVREMIKMRNKALYQILMAEVDRERGPTEELLDIDTRVCVTDVTGGL